MKNNLSPFLLKSICCILFLVPLFSNAQTTHYVKPTATGTGNGSSWLNASASIQDMIDASIPGDQVWVAAGIYYPTKEPDGTTDNPRDFTFYLANGVKLYGGFAGNETDIAQRIQGINVSTLSGDLGVMEDFADNCYHVVLSVNDDAATIIDGFNIVKANANVSDSVIIEGVAIFRNKGGDLCNYSSSTVINNVRFDTCIAYFGAGMYNNGSSPVVTNCGFESNVGTFGGGGMCNENTSSPNISNSIFDNNHAGIGGSGGGMYNINSSPIITNVVFRNHTARLNGGAMYNRNSSPVITNSIFYQNNVGNDNLTGDGGAIYNNSSAPVITNSVFFRNSSYYGGAICDSASSPTIINNTFYNNACIHSGDVIYNMASSSPVIKNCILLKYIYQNSWIPAIGDSNSTPVVTYCDIEGGYSGTGNLNVDPQFVSRTDVDGPDNIFGTADDGLRLRNCSPLINMGNNAGVPATDITGAARIQLGTVDMGSYESSSNTIDTSASISIADTNTTVTLSQASNALTVYTNNCTSLVAMVKGDGFANTVSGNVTARVWIYDYLYDANNIRLVPRHYEILPAANASTATARVTLYFTQMDFDVVTIFFGQQFNLPGLPIQPNDALGKSNLRVLKYNGASNDGTGLMGSYTNGSTIIDPADSDIVWNATESRWEVTFDVTGFGGFFVQRAFVVVPVRWISVNAMLNIQNHAVISWKVQEQNVLNYGIQQSADGAHFSTIGTINSPGDGENSYSFTKAQQQMGNYFYRIQQTNKDGTVNYSAVMKLQYSNALPVVVAIYPNPANENTCISITLEKKEAIQYRLTDNTGRILFQNNLQLNTGNTVIPLFTAKLSPGIYYVNVIGETFTKQIALVKQ